jgi:hypothetical protein
VADTRNGAEIQSLVVQRWPALDEKAVEATGGDREGILALLEGRLGYARANAERDFDELLSGESTVVPKDVADDRQHTGTAGPTGDVHGSFDESGRERQDTGGEQRSGGSSAGALVNDMATRDARRAEEYAEGEQGASRRESDNTDSRTIPPPDMGSEEERDTDRMRRAS